MKNTHLALIVSLMLTAVAACAQPAPPSSKADEEALIGLWGVEEMLGPAIRGQLTIDARSTEWQASIAGTEAAVKRNKDAISFALPENKGEFRGYLLPQTKKITGHWIQPGENYPFNQRYATPVQLSQVQPNVWRGNVAPLEQSVSFYVSIQRAPDGAITAFIRNPEANFYRRRLYKVQMSGPVVL